MAYLDLKLNDKKVKLQKYLFLIAAINITFMLLLLLIPNSLFLKAFASSPAFDQVLIPDKKIEVEKSDWIQTHGNDSSHLKSGYANILAVD